MKRYICGLDEVGRGALAGPLIAVAALFDTEGRATETAHSPIEGVNDSKKLSPKKRTEVFHRILRYERLLDFGIGEISAHEINTFGINWANNMAFRLAIADLKYLPEHILVDGSSPVIGWDMNHQTKRAQGDGYWWPVGAASILAKVIRDSFMAELSSDFPHYGWGSNMGYGSEEHKEALRTHGSCHLHRKQFVRKITEQSY